MTELLSVQGLSVRFGLFEALTDVSFGLSRGDYVGVIGPNGSGKSTLMKALLGLLPSCSGTVSLSPGIRIGYLPQKTSNAEKSFPATAEEIVLTGRLALKGRTPFYDRTDRVAVRLAMEKLRISDLGRKRIGHLSGGQVQRVHLARALVSEPDLLILDEPASALDPSIRSDFYALIADLNESTGTAVLLVSHDLASMGQHAKKMLYLDRSVVFYGTYSEFCGSERMTEYFGFASQHLICRRHGHE